MEFKFFHVWFWLVQLLMNIHFTLKNFLHFIIAVIVFCFASSPGLAAVIITPASNGGSICSDTYTSLGDIIINEASNTDISNNQTSKTLILTLPAGYEFNPGAGTVSALAGGDVTVSFLNVISSSITLTFTTNGNPSAHDQFTISGLQVKASLSSPIASPGNILRTAANPGTGIISGITNDVTDFGILTQSGSMTFFSSTVAQITSLVNPNSFNNQIIRIEINNSGACQPFDASSFTFNMNGTTSLSDIENAKLFFTGTNPVFNSSNQIGSTIASPTGSFSINGFSQILGDGINYFWLAVDVVAGATLGNFVDAECTSLIADAISRTPSTTAPGGNRTITAPVIFTVGSSGETYTTIQAAYNAIPASPANTYIIELYGDYNSALETFPIAFGSKSNTFNIIVRPALGESGIVCAGSMASQGIWNIDNARNIIIDGRPGGMGTTNQFIVRNTKAAAPFGTAYLIRNDAQYISFVYMYIEAETTTGASLDGIVTIGPTTGSNGNDNIVFSFCTLRDLSVGGSGMLPYAGIFSSGTVSKPNDNIEVDNCKFPYGGFPAISFFANTSQTTISNNHIYCPAGMTIAGTPAQAIYVNSGSDHIISGNFIGGTAAYCGGGQFNISSGTNQVFGIYINASGNNIITGNQFSNFKYITTFNLASFPLVGISLNGAGNYTIGSSGNGNLIGNMSLTGDILLTQNGSSGLGIAGIENNSTGSVSISYNTIGGITVGGTRAGANSMIIKNSAGTTSIDNNIIGGDITNSISINSASNFEGIYNSAAGGISITNSILKNINVASGSGAYNFFGIDNTAGPLSCLNNNFRNISSSYNGKCAVISHYTGTITTATINDNAFQDITLSNAGTSARLFVLELWSSSAITVNGNTIGSITAGNILVNGDGDTQIIYKGGSGSLTATDNTIQGLSMTSGGTATGFEGIYCADGVLTCTGNTIQNISINTTSTGNFGSIFSSTALSGNLISNNTIKNVNYSNSAAIATMNNGIQLKGGGSGSVTKNLITELSNASTSATAKLIGIEIFSGAWNIYNNVILLNNNGATNAMGLYGMEAQEATLTNTIYHNTIKIYGSQSAGATNSAALYRIAAGVYTVKNNLFQNLRTGGTGAHYAEYSTIATGTYSSDFNYLETPDAAKLCNYNGTNYNLAGWKGAPVNAVNSVSGTSTLDASGIVITDPFSGAGTGTNLSAAVTDDKNNITRGIASWMGAFEGPNITTAALSPTSYCSGDAVSVSYTVGGGGNFNAGNNFTAQLSDASGNFGTPATIGILGNTTTSGTIGATIPGGTSSGNLYRIRVISSDPSVTGSDNGTSLIISLGIPAAPTANAASGITCSGFTANWSAVTGAGNYYLDVATDAGFTAFVSGYNNLDVGNFLNKSVSGLIAGTPYFYRVRASASCGTSASSGTISPSTTGTQQTYIVTSAANGTTGDGISLRWAITQANANCGHDIIKFNLGAGGPFTITLTAALPNIIDNDGVTIDGWDNSGNNGTPNSVPVFNATASPANPMNPVYKIILGNGGTVPTGLILASNNNIIQGLVLQDFGDGTPSINDIAITITGNNNEVLGCFIGMDPTGTTGGTKTGDGIAISGANNRVGDGTAQGANLISGLNGALEGILISGAGATGNSIKGNMIGLQKDGTSIVAGASQFSGIYIYSSAISNTIGGTAPGEGNVISGQSGANSRGIYLNTSSAGGNTVTGNIIGPCADGITNVTSNTQVYGIMVSSSPDNIIGGNTADVRNIISANLNYGVDITGAASTGNVVKGNYIGIDKTGTTFIGGSTQDKGVGILSSAASNTIGGTEAYEGNVISGNMDATSTGKGIYFFNSGAGNTVLGNIIGPQADGITFLASSAQSRGIEIETSPNNTIGGNSPGARNIISANSTYGVYFTGGSSTGNIVKGNYIGIDKNGTAFISGSSQDYGVYITSSAASNIIGGSGPGEGNVISANQIPAVTGYGVYTNSSGAAGNSILGNIIGPQADGINNITGNNDQSNGIYISNSPNNIIGGNTPGARNIISANQVYGIFITGAGSTGNIIKGNYIGIDKNGTTFISGSSQNNGVYITSSAGGNTIGGSGAGEGNVISGNNDGISTGNGVYSSSDAAAGNTFIGNIIGPQEDGISYLASNAQNSGIYISNSPNNTIGGSTPGERNIISGNETAGVYILGASSIGNDVKGNYIGIDKNGTAVIAGSSQDYGILLAAGESNVIGGGIAGEGNVISGNTNTGFYTSSASVSGNILQGNKIGPQADGLTYLASGSQAFGVQIFDSPNNIIGGNNAFERNIISANESSGIYLTGTSSTGNVIKGNYIGIAQNGTSIITSSTQNYGIYLDMFSGGNNIIGGTGIGEGNVISGNKDATSTGRGIYTNSPDIAGNTVIGNIIGPQADGITYLTSNGQYRGIEIYDSPNNIIGGNTTEARNIISANESRGITITEAGSTGNTVIGNYIGPGSSLANIAGSSQDYGVYILRGSSNNNIGGAVAGNANQIAFNTVNGIYLFNFTTIGNLISRNPLYNNTGKPIDLNYGANQGNNGKAIPIITTAIPTTVSGTSEPGNVIEVFKNTTTNCFDAGNFVGSATANGSGNWSLAASLSQGDYVLATATDGSNNTSEFSTCAPVVVDRYWVGGNSSWNVAGNWSSSSGGAGGAGVPDINSNVFIDNLSGTVTITVPSGTWYTKGFSMTGAGARSSILGQGVLLPRP